MAAAHLPDQLLQILIHSPNGNDEDGQGRPEVEQGEEHGHGAYLLTALRTDKKACRAPRLDW